jgi:hypothetical protein
MLCGTLECTRHPRGILQRWLQHSPISSMLRSRAETSIREQHVAVTMCQTWPELCSFLYSGRDKDWFVIDWSWLANGFVKEHESQTLSPMTDCGIDANGISQRRCNFQVRSTRTKPDEDYARRPAKSKSESIQGA